MRPDYGIVTAELSGQSETIVKELLNERIVAADVKGRTRANHGRIRRLPSAAVKN